MYSIRVLHGYVYKQDQKIYMIDLSCDMCNNDK